MSRNMLDKKHPRLPLDCIGEIVEYINHDYQSFINLTCLSKNVKYFLENEYFDCSKNIWFCIKSEIDSTMTMNNNNNKNNNKGIKFVRNLKVGRKQKKNERKRKFHVKDRNLMVFPNLQNVKLCNCSEVKGQFLGRIKEKIQSISIFYCPLFDEKNLYQCRKLKYLNLVNDTTLSKYVPYTDKLFKNLSNCLETLKIKGSNVDEFSSDFPSLRKFSASYCGKISERVLTKMPNLEEVFFEECPIRLNEKFNWNYPKRMRLIRIEECSFWKEEDLRKIIDRKDVKIYVKVYSWIK